jgi:Protein of unknown function (DUF3631)
MTSPTMAGTDLLDALYDVLNTYVVFPGEHAAVAVTCWIAATHAVPAFECAPRLVLTSPEKRCGKSRALDIIAGTSHRPLPTSDATVAAIFRSIGDGHPPTLIIDEADAIFGSKKVAEQNEDLRKLLNAGHQRGRPALRCVGKSLTPTEFPVFAMAALAGIGSMPDTITDRAVNISMRRRMRGEEVAPFRSRRDAPVLSKINEELGKWAAAHLDLLHHLQPDMPVQDRAADTWEPLVAIAEVAGGRWPERIRAACVALVEDADNDDAEESLSITLLSDIKHVFEQAGVPFLTSQALVDHLKNLDESPWSDFELNPRKLALRLRRFDISPGHNTAKTHRGYTREAFHDAFERYLRPNPSEPSGTTAEQEEQRDGKKTPDGSTRPEETTRPTEDAVHGTYRTSRTGSDAPQAKTTPKAASTSRPKAQGDVPTAQILELSARNQKSSSKCVDCRKRPAMDGFETCGPCSVGRGITRAGLA